MPQFVITENGEVRVEVWDKPVLLIGSGENTDMRFSGIAPLHCQIKKTDQGYLLSDLSGEGNTFVNGLPVREQILRHGDIIQIGNISFVFHLASSESPASSSSQLELDEDEDYSLDFGDLESHESSVFDLTALQRDQLRNFLNLNMPISTIPDLDLLLDRVLDSVLNLTSSTSGIILIYDENFRLLPRCKRNLPKQTLKEAIRYILKPVAKRVAETQSMLTISDIEKCEFLDLQGFSFPEYQTLVGIPLRTMAKEYGVLSQASAHLHPANRMLGVLILMRHKGHPSFSEAEIPMMEAISHQVAVAIFNLKLHMMASTDPLTGLYNRNYFQANLAEELAFAKTKKHPLSIAIVDIDNFKRFNEFYGAKTGDVILKRLARILLAHTRDIDLLARYGGDKFVFLFLHTTPLGAKEVLERAKGDIHQFLFAEEGYRVTVSAGIASFPEHGSSPEQLVERADQALFRAKQSGKNQVVIWEKEKDLGGERKDHLAGLVTGNLAKDYQHMQALMDTIRLRGEASDPRELVNLLLAKVMEVTHTERAMIFENTKEGIRYTLAKDRLGQDLYDDIMLPYSKQVVEKVLEGKVPVHLIWHPSKEYGKKEEWDDTYTRSVLCAPLRDRERDWGVLYVDSPDIEREITEADINFFDAFAKQIALAITQAKLHEELQEKERMAHEFNIAAKIQQDLLPSEFPTIQGIEIYGRTQAAKEVGGDYYDVISSNDGEFLRHFLCIGDVSGKGLPAGLVMIMARTALHSLIATGSLLSPAELLFFLNQMIYENTDQGVFMSMLICEVLEDGIEYASAGHEHILIYRHKTQEVEAIRSGGVVLGLSPHIPSFENKFIPLEPGDFMLLYTDGATEAQNLEGEEFQLERLKECCLECGRENLSSKEIVDRTFDKLFQFFKGMEQHDDITLLVTRRCE